MSDFNREFLNALLNREKFDEFMRGQLQTALNSLLESELTAFLGYNIILMTVVAGIPVILGMEAMLESSRLNSVKLRSPYHVIEKENSIKEPSRHMVSTLTRLRQLSFSCTHMALPRAKLPS